MFAGKKSAQIREILISESAWEEMTCLFAPSKVCVRNSIGLHYGISAGNLIKMITLCTAKTLVEKYLN
ncbi:hypothetical protein EIZ98_22225 [Escherichia coli]|nr:hypothetical protein [Escherichia coli]